MMRLDFSNWLLILALLVFGGLTYRHYHLPDSQIVQNSIVEGEPAKPAETPAPAAVVQSAPPPPTQPAQVQPPAPQPPNQADSGGSEPDSRIAEDQEKAARDQEYERLVAESHRQSEGNADDSAPTHPAQLNDEIRGD